MIEKPLFTTKAGMDVYLSGNGYIERPTELGLSARETEEDLGVLGKPIVEPIRIDDPAAPAAAKQYGALLLNEAPE